MNSLSKPKNDWAKALYILYDAYISGVSMADVLTRYEPCFYKFQARLGEILEHHPKLVIQKNQNEYTSRMDGKKRRYFLYRIQSPHPYVINLYNLINEKGLTGSVSEGSKNIPVKKQEDAPADIKKHAIQTELL